MRRKRRTSGEGKEGEGREERNRRTEAIVES
jgi:hypothetical protein